MVMVHDRLHNIYKYNSMEVQEIVRDYTSFRLRLAGYNNWGNEPTEHPTPAMRTMRLLGQQFEEAFNSVFEDMAVNIDISGPGAHEAFVGICTVLFENGIRWGRIVGLMVFSAKLSLNAMEVDIPNQVDNIVQWTNNHLLSDRFSNWISDNGGWMGFVEFYDRPENQNNHQNGEFSWTKACSLGIATIAGAAAALHFFVQKS